MVVRYNENADGSSKATAREVALELGGFTKSLREASQKLEGEIRNIETAKGEIKEELSDTVKTFVKNTLTDLKGEQYANFAKLSQSTPEVGTQSLAFFTKKLTDARDAALQSVNASLTETIDTETFQQRYEQAKTDSQAARTKGSEASTAARSAQGAITSWQGTGDYEFLAMDRQMEKNGKSLTDNRALYEPKGAFQKIWNYITKGSDYRGVRKALKDYGHGVNGKDAFADLAGFKTKDTQLEQALTTAKADAAAAATAQASADQILNKFGAAASSIKTDEQILGLVQDKVVSYFSTPAFVTAVGAEYGKDFPNGIPLMMAKLQTLDKLEEGVQDKLETANKNYTAAAEQYAKISRVPAYQKVNVDMDDLQKRNRARIQEYDNYASAANRSWNRTKSYSPSTTVVYVDNSPSFFEMMLINDILNSNNNRYYEPHQHHTFTPAPDSCFAANLLGLDKGTAATYNIPASAFDVSPEVVRQMQDIGVNDYKADAYRFDITPSAASNDNKGADSLFDTAISEAATPARSPTTWSPGERGYGNANPLFDTDPAPAPASRSRDDSPSFGGFGSTRS